MQSRKIGLIALVAFLSATTPPFAFSFLPLFLTPPALAQIPEDNQVESKRPLPTQTPTNHQVEGELLRVDTEDEIRGIPELEDSIPRPKIGEQLGKQRRDRLLSFPKSAFPTKKSRIRDGYLLFQKGQFQAALKSYQRALVDFVDKSDRDGFGYYREKVWDGIVFNSIGEVYDKLGQYADALNSYQQALDIFNRLGDKAKKKSINTIKQESGITLNNIGEVYDKLGQDADALNSYQQALNIFKQSGNKEESGMTLNSIGAVYTRLGQYPDALKFHQQALDIFKQLNSKPGEGTTLNNIGEVYTRLGQYPNALKFHQQALDIFNQLGKKTKKKSFLHTVSVILNATAVVVVGSPIPGGPSGLNPPPTLKSDQVLHKVEKGIALNGIGAVYTRLGQYPDALQFYQQALDVFKQLGYKVGEGITLSNTGVIYRRSGQYADALKFYQQALDIFKQSGSKAESGITLNTIGSIYFVLGQYPDAERTLIAAVQVLESLRSGLTDASKVSIFETQSNTYRLLQQTLIAQKKFDTALEVAEQGRARAFVELLATRSPLQHETQLTSAPLTIQQIQQVAKAQNATLVEYSVSYNRVRPLIDLVIESCYELKSEKRRGWHGGSIDKYRRDKSEDGSDHRTESFDVNQ